MPTTHTLKRSLTAFSVWSLAFGGVIGFGSFMMPGTTFLKRAGTMGTLIAMELAALIMLTISYSYAYMIEKFPDSGGQFVYAEKAFGRTHGFICAWFLGLCYIMIIPMNCTALALVFRAVSERSIFQFGFHYTVAGYDVYSGEVLLALSALSVFSLACFRGGRFAGRLQSVFVVVLIAGVLPVLGGALFSPEVSSAELHPMFWPEDPQHGGALSQVVSVLVVAPWAYVGFDVVPVFMGEADFPRRHAKPIMDTAILCGCFVYVVLNLLSAVGIPERYPDWVSYVAELPGLKGVEGIASFQAARKILGTSGVFIISVSAVMAMLTGILGFYMATSRLLCSMAREKMLPSWFSELNSEGVPFKAVIFCAAVSFLAPFVGRNALGWTVDMSSIGGAISFGYTSLAAVRFAFSEGRRDIVILGAAGFIFSVMFAFLLLVPVPGLDCSLDFPSYVLLVIWIAAGSLFFLRMKGRP
ncbi:MAG: APC family permease [Synergistaceae bacterium]|nr:APC family permease [Synergistaceae bacterium]